MRLHLPTARQKLKGQRFFRRRLLTLSLPLLFFPRFLALLLGPPLTDDDQSGPSLRTLNGLETYLAVSCWTLSISLAPVALTGRAYRQQLTGLSFVTLALILVLQTGAVPLTSSIASAPGDHVDAAVAQAAPFRAPTCALATMFFAALGMASWQVGLKFIAFSSGSLAAFGVYVTLFGNDVGIQNFLVSLLLRQARDADLPFPPSAQGTRSDEQHTLQESSRQRRKGKVVLSPNARAASPQSTPRSTTI